LSEYSLAIGSPRYSSWSLRPWLLMRHLGIDFEHTVIELYRPDTRARILQHSPAGRVPVLKHGAVTVCESLAIVEYLAERHPGLGVWPAAPEARAMARALAAEMHAGFAALRQELPMDLIGAQPRHALTAETQADVARIVEAWGAARAAFGAGGPFLFGAFCGADAMFAPVVVRFLGYGVALEGEARGYAEAVRSLPAMAAWRRLAGAPVN
jgi:glutathione S-transferase